MTAVPKLISYRIVWWDRSLIARIRKRYKYNDNWTFGGVPCGARVARSGVVHVKRQSFGRSTWAYWLHIILYIFEIWLSVSVKVSPYTTTFCHWGRGRLSGGDPIWEYFCDFWPSVWKQLRNVECMFWHTPRFNIPKLRSEGPIWRSKLSDVAYSSKYRKPFPVSDLARYRLPYLV